MRRFAAAKDNLKFNCGYGGGRWADDRKAHYNACAFAPASDAISNERVARTTNLQTCKDKASATAAAPRDASTASDAAAGPRHDLEARRWTERFSSPSSRITSG